MTQPPITYSRLDPRFWLTAGGSERRAALAAINWPLILLVLAGVALRLWYISISPLDPRYSNADDGDYYRRALRLAVTGMYLDDAWLIRPPLHVFFFAFWLRLALAFGVPQFSLLFVQLAQVALAALMPVLGNTIARRLFESPRAGLLFAGFLALWHPLIEGTTVLFTEHLYLLLFLTHLWLLLRYERNGKAGILTLAGVALGAAALTRSPALYAVVFAVGWLIIRALTAGRSAAALAAPVWGLGPAIKGSLLVVAGCLAIVGPWTTRNYLTYGHLIPVDTLGQINLWLDLDAVERRNSNIDTLRGMPQAERHVYALARAREILSADPMRPFRPMWSTFRHIWKAQFVEDFYVKQSFFTRPLREAAPLGLTGDVIWLIFTLAGIVGLAGRVTEGLHHRLFFLAWVGYSLLTVLVFHAEPRYLLPLWTLLALYGAGALARMTRRIRLTPYLALQLALVGAFLWLFVTYRDYPAIISAGMTRERAMNAGIAAYRAGEYAAAEREFRAALAAQSGFVDAQVNLALALAAQQRREEAAAVLRRNSSRHAELVAGALLRDTGNPEQASRILGRIEATAGEDIQRWAIDWLRPPPVTRVQLGNGLDIGYIAGFSPPEYGALGSFRWLEGSGAIIIPLSEPLPAGASINLSVAGAPNAEVTPLTVRIGDGPEWILPIARGQWRSYSIPAPPDQIGASRVTITLRAPTFVPALLDPTSDDARALSLMIAEVRVR